MFKELSGSQKVLLMMLSILLALMIVFSILAAINNFGEKGYGACIEKNVQKKGEQFLEKTRDVSNCCQGAGGKVAQKQDGSYTCVFN